MCGPGISAEQPRGASRLFSLDKNGPVPFAGGQGRPAGIRRHSRAAHIGKPHHICQLAAGKNAALLRGGSGVAVETNTDLILQMHLQPIGKEELHRAGSRILLYRKAGHGHRVQTAAQFLHDRYSRGRDESSGSRRIRLAGKRGGARRPAARALLVQANARLRGPAERHAAVADVRSTIGISIGRETINTSHRLLCRPGTRLVMEYSYDNSTNNARNPNQPPRDVIYGIAIER